MSNISGMNSDLLSPIVRAERLTRQVASGPETLTIVHDISFAVSAGEAIAIVGASGSGKTTLLSMLAGLDTPTSGRIWIGGADFTAMSEDARARLRAQAMGFVFQSFHLLPGLTALENVQLPMELHAVPDSATRARQILERVGLGARLRHYPRTLSGGEQQRVALARAFARSPKLLFADEPTGNLDSGTGEEIIELLLALNQEQSTTLILVTHDPALARRCSRQLRLVAGALAADEAIAQ